jgi:transposase
MTNPTRTRRRFTAQQKAEAVDLCLHEELSCNAMAERLGLASISAARWFRQTPIHHGQPGLRGHGILITEERAERNGLRKENLRQRRDKDFFRLAAAHAAKELLLKGFARSTNSPISTPSPGCSSSWASAHTVFYF